MLQSVVDGEVKDVRVGVCRVESGDHDVTIREDGKYRPHDTDLLGGGEGGTFCHRLPAWLGYVDSPASA